MPLSTQQISPRNEGPLGQLQAFEASDVLIFVEDGAVTAANIRHAQKVANVFGGKVILVQVLCEPVNGKGPIDPVEWDIKKQNTLKQLGVLSRGSERASQTCTVELLEGQCISQIKAFIENRQGDIAASPRFRSNSAWRLSETAWGVLSSQSAAVLMLPDGVGTDTEVRYRRILLPLDGSSRAEIAISTAIKLARAEDADLMLCYVVPALSLSDFEASDAETDRLSFLFRRKNEQAGNTYLERIKKRLEHNGLKISVRLSHGGDVRRALINIMAQENIDFVVMSTHGRSGHKDVPTGDVARFVLDRADIPVLLVRPRNGRGHHHAFGEISSKGTRLPSGSD